MILSYILILFRNNYPKVRDLRLEIEIKQTVLIFSERLVEYDFKKWFGNLGYQYYPKFNKNIPEKTAEEGDFSNIFIHNLSYEFFPVSKSDISTTKSIMNKISRDSDQNPSIHYVHSYPLGIVLENLAKNYHIDENAIFIFDFAEEQYKICEGVFGNDADMKDIDIESGFFSSFFDPQSDRFIGEWHDKEKALLFLNNRKNEIINEKIQCSKKWFFQNNIVFLDATSIFKTNDMNETLVSISNLVIDSTKNIMVQEYQSGLFYDNDKFCVDLHIINDTESAFPASNLFSLINSYTVPFRPIIANSFFWNTSVFPEMALVSHTYNPKKGIQSSEIEHSLVFTIPESQCNKIIVYESDNEILIDKRITTYFYSNSIWSFWKRSESIKPILIECLKQYFGLHSQYKWHSSSLVSPSSNDLFLLNTSINVIMRHYKYHKLRKFLKEILLYENKSIALLEISNEYFPSFYTELSNQFSSLYFQTNHTVRNISKTMFSSVLIGNSLDDLCAKYAKWYSTARASLQHDFCHINNSLLMTKDSLTAKLDHFAKLTSPIWLTFLIISSILAFWTKVRMLKLK